MRKAAELRSRLSRTVLAATSVLVLASCAGILPAEAPTHPASAPATGGNAASALQALPVKGRAPETGYSRDRFGQAWTDDVTVGGGHNGCGRRDDILRSLAVRSTIAGDDVRRNYSICSPVDSGALTASRP